MWKRILAITTVFAMAACADGLDDSGFYIYNYAVDFRDGMDDWWGDFADYPVGENDSLNYELKITFTDLPANLGTGKKALMLSGNNHSDDLFMFIKKKITGLQPSTDYNIVFAVQFASNAPKGGFGAGGAPGESVFVKAGATSIEPKKVIEGNYYRLNIDKGNQAVSGENMRCIGDIAVAESTTQFTTIERSSDYNSAPNSPFIAKSNSHGELWLIIGTDSGYEGITTIYYTQVNVVLSRSN